MNVSQVNEHRVSAHGGSDVYQVNVYLESAHGGSECVSSEDVSSQYVASK